VNETILFEPQGQRHRGTPPAANPERARRAAWIEAGERGAPDGPQVDDEALLLLDTLTDRLSLTDAQWVYSVVAGRRVPTGNALDRALARRALPGLIAQHPGASDRQLAAMLKVSPHTIAQWKKKISEQS
jgi:hypothetical protein